MGSNPASPTMCGRFVGNFNTQDLLDEILAAGTGVTVRAETDLPPRLVNHNAAPTQPWVIVRADGSGLLLETALWGLVPSWSKDPSVASKMINARSETVTEKPSFRGLVRGHRAVVPVSGFYEWDRTDSKNKRPYFVPRADGRTMWVAGLWTASPSLDGTHTFSMLTRESLDDLAAIHHRSPVQLDMSDALSWACDPVAPLHLVTLVDPPRLAPYEVGREVNSVRNNHPGLTEPVVPGEPDTLF